MTRMAGSAVTGAEQLTGGTDQFASELGKAATGAGQLSQATAALAEGTNALAFGSAEVGTALETLALGADQAANGSAELATGAGDIDTHDLIMADASSSALRSPDIPSCISRVF